MASTESEAAFVDNSLDSVAVDPFSEAVEGATKAAPLSAGFDFAEAAASKEAAAGSSEAGPASETSEVFDAGGASLKRLRRGCDVTENGSYVASLDSELTCVDVANAVDSGEGMTEGREVGRPRGNTGGRVSGSFAGSKPGNTGGRTGGSAGGRTEGKDEAEGSNEGIEVGKLIGKQSGLS